MKKRSFIFYLLFFFFFNRLLYSGITGTLAGRVVDQKTEKPLAGVNVLIVDSYLGAATDEDGFFLINNVPAGKYEVKAQMMGYRSVILKDVHILMDLRTTLLFELATKVLEMQEIVVTASAPMIQRDVTSTTHFISQQEIDQLPVLSFTEIVNIQPGVAAGHIRGGRQNEVLYLVDGFPIQEVIEGKVGSELPMSSIIDMTVQTGGFNAEYGNAMSGVVNIITRDGGDRFNVTGEVSGLKYQTFSNPFNDRDMELDWINEIFIGTPIINKKLRIFASADLRMPNTRWKREEFGHHVMIFNTHKSYNANFNSKLTWTPSKSLRMTLQGLLSIWNWIEYDHKWKKNIMGLADRSKNSYRFSLTSVHTLSPKTFYEIRLSQYNVLKSIFGAASHNMAGIQYENNDPWMWVIYGDYPWWLDHQEIQTTLKFDLTSQITKHHQLKTGTEITYYDLYKKNVQRLDITTYDPSFPQYITYDTEYHYYPIKGSLYIQDKIEHEGMVVNAGIRFDIFDPKAERPALEEKIYGNRSEWIIEFDKTTPASAKTQISPRVGLAIPMGIDRELHVNYGHFFQMPLFDYLYMNSNLNVAEGFSPLGDPDLKPSKTVTYEISYKNQVGDDMLLDFTIFNKEVSNLVDNNTFLNRQKGALTGTGYSQFVNMESVNVWGSEIYLKRRVGEFISGKISYTYMIAKGTGSENTEKFSWLTKDTKVPISEYYLSWDQRHTLVVNIDIRKFKNWGVNVLYTLNSPLPYTKYRGVLTEPNNKRMDIVSILDIRLNKDFTVLKTPTTAFLELLNVLDRKNLLWVDAEGRPGGLLYDPSAWDERFRLRLGVNMKL